MWLALPHHPQMIKTPDRLAAERPLVAAGWTAAAAERRRRLVASGPPPPPGGTRRLWSPPPSMVWGIPRGGGIRRDPGDSGFQERGRRSRRTIEDAGGKAKTDQNGRIAVGEETVATAITGTQTRRPRRRAAVPGEHCAPRSVKHISHAPPLTPAPALTNPVPASTLGERGVPEGWPRRTRQPVCPPWLGGRGRGDSTATAPCAPQPRAWSCPRAAAPAAAGSGPPEKCPREGMPTGGAPLPVERVRKQMRAGGGSGEQQGHSLWQDSEKTARRRLINRHDTPLPCDLRIPPLLRLRQVVLAASGRVARRRFLP